MIASKGTIVLPPRTHIYFFRRTIARFPCPSALALTLESCSPAPLASPDRNKAKQDEAVWQGEFGRVAGKDWASSERVDNVRSIGRRTGSESPPRLLGRRGLELQPSGPRGPDSPLNRGKPEWYKMLQQHSNSDEDDEQSSDEMHSEDGDDTFDDEMQKVSDKDMKESAKRSRERATGARAAMANRSLTYGEYLHLDKILGSQQPQSAIFDTEVHEEMLFIVIHQAYELWFKQILHELDAIKSTFESALSEGWGPMDMGMCVERANRMAVVMRVLVHQMDVLETMQPQQFQDFRDFLNPASGFQSVQFRKIENKLGLRQEQRIQHSGCPYYEHLEKQEEQAEVLESEKGRSLAQLLGEWLGGLMNDTCPGFDFAAYMRNSIELAAEHDRDAISKYPQSHLSLHPGAGPSGREGLLAELEKKKTAHMRLFDRAAHDELVRKGIRHFGFEATMACVFVQSFSNELAFQAPHRLITHLIEIDELLAQWRHRHSLVVMRMIGSKNGTGGSSGHAYLNAVLAKSRIFTDLCHASHYLLPRHSMPPLPPMVRARLTTGFKPEATLIPRGARAKSFS